MNHPPAGQSLTGEPGSLASLRFADGMNAILALEDGTVFRGCGFGAEARTCGEVCFNTSMTGYQEILTDPSYKGQIVTMTYPHIGNYGVNEQDVESWRPHVAGFVIRELSPVVSSWRADASLQAYLREHGIPGIQGIDTRALTRRLRVRGALRGCLSTTEISDADAVQAARDWPGLAGVDYVREVTHPAAFAWDVQDARSASFRLLRGRSAEDPRKVRDSLPPADLPIVAYDFGIKYNILRRLRQRGFQVTVVPAHTPAEEVLRQRPAGVFLSNGPGDPSALGYAVRAAADLLHAGIPIFGICLGHQILGQALGGRTFKLKFGHRGANQPVKDLRSGRVEITSQNHGFAVDPASLPAEVEIDRVNLNDQTVEGFRHRTKPVFCVQYHPEASPGPHDSSPLFDEFRALILAR
jgi:carbamoyl-phosphate synthase small subunit